MNPQKLIFLILYWGWRGPAVLAVVLFIIFIFSLWDWYR